MRSLEKYDLQNFLSCHLFTPGEKIICIQTLWTISCLFFSKSNVQSPHIKAINWHLLKLLVYEHDTITMLKLSPWLKATSIKSTRWLMHTINPLLGQMSTHTQLHTGLHTGKWVLESSGPVEEAHGKGGANVIPLRWLNGLLNGKLVFRWGFERFR